MCRSFTPRVSLLNRFMSLSLGITQLSTWGILIDDPIQAAGRHCLENGLRPRDPAEAGTWHASGNLPYCHLDFLGLNNETPGGSWNSGQNDRNRPGHDEFVRRR